MLKKKVQEPIPYDRSGSWNVNIGISTLKSMKQSTEQVKSYDALDVAEGFSLAYEQSIKLLIMIRSMSCVYDSQISLIRNVYNLPDLALHDVEGLFDITKTMIHEFAQYSKSQHELYINQA